MIVATGSAFTVTAVTALVAWHPADVNPVTVYDPVDVAITLCVVAPLLHRYDANPGAAVKVTAELAHRLNGPLADTDIAGRGLNTT